MGYQVVFKQYAGTKPVKQEIFALKEGVESQGKNLEQFPCRIQCTYREDGAMESFLLTGEALGDMDEPISLSLEYVKEDWKRTEYVFFPAAVYDGNSRKSYHIPYPPYHVGKNADGTYEQCITDIPHLDREKPEARIQLRSGDMSTPAMGYYDDEKKEGLLILAKHWVHDRYTGFSVAEKENTAAFTVSLPAVREEKKYFFGEALDGSGFYPSMEYPSDDRGLSLKRGDRLKFEVRVFHMNAENRGEYFKQFNELREHMEQGTDVYSIPFSTAYKAVKEKYAKMNFVRDDGTGQEGASGDEGYYRVGTENEAAPSFWQAGWVGGGMNIYSFLLEDNGINRAQSRSTLKFIVDHLQWENGWYVPMYAKGKKYGDNFLSVDSPVILVRKNTDMLYFLIKQLMVLDAAGDEIEGLKESVRRQADAFVGFFEKNGQLGQFIDSDTEELLAGGTASASTAPAALALAYEYFKEARYLETAEKLGTLYWEEYLKKGFVNGGPGEICQAPDSESAFGLLESYVQLYETTQKAKWLEAAKEAFELAITWVVSYDFNMPMGGTAANMGAHTRGTVFANAQNKHSAPGICTLSGNSMLKLYRFTGDEKYLNWMLRISHALSQFVSLPDRLVQTLSAKPLLPGYFNERVQMSDWEGKETIGEFLYGSNWPETSMLLTYVEVPGIYVDLERRNVWCNDHVKAELTGNVLHITNPTAYPAEVTVFVDEDRSKKLGHNYFCDMRKVSVPAGGEATV